MAIQASEVLPRCKARAEKFFPVFQAQSLWSLADVEFLLRRAVWAKESARARISEIAGELTGRPVGRSRMIIMSHAVMREILGYVGVVPVVKARPEFVPSHDRVIFLKPRDPVAV